MNDTPTAAPVREDAQKIMIEKLSELARLDDRNMKPNAGAIRRWCAEAADIIDRLALTIMNENSEIGRLRGLLIDPGSPAWEDTRAVLVAELRKAGLDKLADGVANADGSYVPSHIALNLIAQAARRPTVGDGSGILQAAWDAQPDLPPIEFTPAEEAAIYAAFQAAPTSDVARASRHSTLEARVLHVGADDGYATAFYEIATMLGIGAQAASPADVWRNQMRPKLQALTSRPDNGGDDVDRAAKLRPNLDCETDEPSLEEMVLDYYRQHFEVGRAFNLRDRYFAALAAIREEASRGKVKRFQHVKRGTVYEMIGTAELQAGQPHYEHAELAIYRGDDGKLWARNTGEFNDGRFVAVSEEPPTPARGFSRFDPPGLWESEPRSSADISGQVIR